MLPHRPRMMLFSTIMTMPEENSVTSEGRPSDRTAPTTGRRKARRRRAKPARRRCSDRMARLIQGARPVAKTAPKMPIWQGKMNT